MSYSEKPDWESHSLDIPEETISKFEPNFSITKVKLSTQEILVLQVPLIQEKSTPTITQNNIFFINSKGYQTNQIDNTKIIINNNFPESNPMQMLQSPPKVVESEGLSKKESSRSDVEIRMHKSSFRGKSPSPYKEPKRVSFSNQIMVLYKEQKNDLAPSHFAKPKKKKGCSCGGLLKL